MQRAVEHRAYSANIAEPFTPVFPPAGSKMSR